MPLFRTADVDALPEQHPEIAWTRLRALRKGQRSPLAALGTAAPPAGLSPPGPGPRGAGDGPAVRAGARAPGSA
ncbi:hypothetical protein GCM10027168_11790 [Streptomyces capparidis]